MELVSHCGFEDRQSLRDDETEPARRHCLLGDASATDSDNPFDYFGSGEVAIHGVVLEDDAKTMDAMIACLEQATKAIGGVKG
jgi:hypothetical protein